MNYAEFQEAVVAEMNERGYEAFVRSVEKNNGVVLQGLVVRSAGVNISPTIYLEYYYEKLEDGVSFDSIVDRIEEKYEEYKLNDNFDISVFTEWEKAETKLVYKLINASTNEALLKEVPHIMYLDLAIVFMVLLECNGEFSSILVRNPHMKHWDKKPEELYEVAKENTPKLLNLFEKNLTEILKEQGLVPEDFEDEMPLTLVSNQQKLYGAGAILYPQMLENLAAEKESDLVLIPSSVHEFLITPLSEEMDEEYMNGLVNTVNTCEVEEEEVLSDHIYYFRRGDGVFMA